MEREKAYYAISLLVGSLGGDRDWPPETIDSYVSAIEDLSDGDLMVRACDEVRKTWNAEGNQYGVPSPGFIRKAYGQLVMRRELHGASEPPRGELSSGDRPVDWRRGVEIARAEYAKECQKRGIEPRQGQPESMMARCYEPSEGQGLRRFG